MSDPVREAFEKKFCPNYKPTIFPTIFEYGAFAGEYVRVDLQGQWEAFKAGRESMRKEAVKACEEEHLQGPTESEGDTAYDNAVRDCKSAIKELP